MTLKKNVDGLVVDSDMRMSDEHSSRVLVIDDEPMVRHGVALLLENENGFMICGEIGDSDSTLVTIQRTQPDVVILDLFLGESDGLQLTKIIRSSYPSLPILILSLHSESIFAESCVRIGANGYLMKSDAAEHLVQAIQTVLRGEIYVSDFLRKTSTVWQRMI